MWSLGFSDKREGSVAAQSYPSQALTLAKAHGGKAETSASHWLVTVGCADGRFARSTELVGAPPSFPVTR